MFHLQNQAVSTYLTTNSRSVHLSGAVMCPTQVSELVVAMRLSRYDEKSTEPSYFLQLADLHST